jgi:hypothetical protein
MSGIADKGPIVPWRMNAGSGTEATFNNFIKNNAADTNHCTGVSTLDVSAQATARPLNDGTSPFENDTKPVLNDAIANPFNPGVNPTGVTMPQCTGAPAGIVADVTSCQDPANWIWWGSFGLMGSHSFLSTPTIGATTYNITPFAVADFGTSGGQRAAITCGQNGTTLEPCTATSPPPVGPPEAGTGVLPGTGSFGLTTYALTRDLYIATPKASADCPLNGATPAACDLTGTASGGQQGDIQVTGASGGSGGAVREFVRFVCRLTTGTTQQSNDPFNNKNYTTEITSALQANGFIRVPAQNASNGLSQGYQSAFKQAGLGKSAGSSCSVLSTPTAAPQP